MGLKLQSRPDREVLGFSNDDEADQWETNTEREFRLWADSQICDIRKTLYFQDIQDLAFRQTLENGDVFILMARETERSKDFPYSLRLQVIEADRICNKDNAGDSETLVGGVEKEKTGAPKAYHILNHHPGNWLFANKDKSWDIVPAFGEKTGMRNVIHLYRVLRPGQTRGVPYLTPVVEPLKQLTRYTEAELMATVVSSLFTVFIKTEFSGMSLGPMKGEPSVSSGNGEEDIKLGNGALISLRPGESVETADPKRPNTAFDPFIKAILEQVGVALEIPFEVLIGHFSASYSASRAALLEAWRFFRGRRSWLARSFCQPVYENFLTEGVALGRIKAPGFFSDPLRRMAYCGALWIGDAPSQIDPLKEVDASEKRVKLGLSTLDEETVMLTGGDFETNYPRILKERKKMQEAGLWISEKDKLSLGGGGMAG
jgi:lambda family phage portal protein